MSHDQWKLDSTEWVVNADGRVMAVLPGVLSHIPAGMDVVGHNEVALVLAEGTRVEALADPKVVEALLDVQEVLICEIEDPKAAQPKIARETGIPVHRSREARIP